MAVVKTKRMICADLKNNHNKFWEISLHCDGRVITRWGRVGDSGQETMLGYGGESLYQRKIAEKQKKHYVEASVLPSTGTLLSKPVPASSLEQLATTQIAANTPEAIRLIKKLAQANVHDILAATTLSYNAESGLFSTPLGIVTQEGLDEARRVLERVAYCVRRRAWQDAACSRAANRFLTLIPSNIGRRRQDCHDLFPDMKAVHAKAALIDNLESSLKVALQPSGDQGAAAQQQVFAAKVHLVQDTAEFDCIKRRYRRALSSHHSCSSLKVRRVYTVCIDAMEENFKTEGATIGNIHQLWHGTGSGNILSILHSGFKISPPATAHLTGSMFSNGIYLSPVSSKALAYSHGYWSGQRHKVCYLFLVDTAVGKYQVPSGPTSKRPSPGHDSYWAKAGKSGVYNDEVVVFKECQLRITHLLELTEE